MTRNVRTVRCTPIGVIHSPLKNPVGAPIQSVSAKKVEGIVEVFPQFARGLRDVAGFSNIILLYHFHTVSEFTLTVIPFLDGVEHGVFSTRAPARPNPIGMSVVQVRGVAGRMIRVRGLDVIDRTPLLDIKPYVPYFDSMPADKIGWYTGRINGTRLSRTKADGRFVRSSVHSLRYSKSRTEESRHR